MKKLLLTFPIFIITFLGFFHPITDFSQDLGRHLKLGEIILQTHTVPKVNFFAYTYPTFPFINHHWLSEVVFFLIYVHLGSNGLLTIMSLVGAMSFSLIFWTSLKYRNYIISYLSAILYLIILLERVGLRPEIFSFFFLSCFFVLLFKNHDKATRWIFLLPLIELLWVNMHIYFPVGILLTGLFLGEQLLEKKYSKQLLIIFILCCIAIFFNPNGITGALYPLHIFSNYGYAIQENQTLLFLIQYGMWFPWFTSILFLLTIMSILAITSLKKEQTFSLIVIGIFSLTAFLAVRNFSLFVFATFVPFTALLSPLATKLESFLKQKTAIVAIALIVGIIFFLKLSVDIYGIGTGVTPSAENATDFFIMHHLTGPILNNFDIGSYLDYKLYPKEKVFVDGRPEAYPVDFFQKEYIPLQQNVKIFEQMEKKYHFRTIFWAHTDSTPWSTEFLQTILKNRSWNIVYLDGSIVILTKTNKHTASLALSENDFVGERISLPNDELNLLRIARILDYAQWKNAEIHVLQHILIREPNSCTTLVILSSLLQEKNDPISQVYRSSYTQQCQ